MKNFNFYSGKTQVYWVCQALINGRTINQQTELREVRGWRLPAIIFRLKSEFNWPIDDEKRGSRQIAYYFLKAGTDKSKLRLPRSAQSLGQGDAQ